jgi:hypothetical protein
MFGVLAIVVIRRRLKLALTLTLPIYVTNHAMTGRVGNHLKHRACDRWDVVYRRRLGLLFCGQRAAKLQDEALLKNDLVPLIQ